MDFDDYYQNNYMKVINAGLVGAMSNLVHWSLENSPYSKRNKPNEGSAILELGAGHGQHHPFVSTGFSSYVLTDLRPENIPRNLESKSVRIHPESIDAHALPFQSNSFDRVIATCLLIHLKDPPLALSEWYRVLKPGGVMTVYVPCETGTLLRIAQQISTRRKQKKLGLDAEFLHRTEHPYSYLYVKGILRYLFANQLRIRKFPFVLGSWNFNLWAVVTIVKSKEKELLADES